MRVSVIFPLLLLFCIVSCGNGETSSKVDPGGAAVHYIRSLADGRYDEYIHAMVSCDSASDAYKKQMLVLHKQMVTTQKTECGSLETVQCVRSELGREGKTANVFLQLTYSNGMKEDIMLPLVWNNEKWRIR